MSAIDIVCGFGTLAVLLGFLPPAWMFLFGAWLLLELVGAQDIGLRQRKKEAEEGA